MTWAERVAKSATAVVRHGPAVAITACALPLLVRWTVRDDVPGLSMIFYAGRPVIGAFVSLAAAVLLVSRRRWRLCAAAAVVCVASAWVYAATSFVWNEERPAGGDSVHAVLWNTGHGTGGWEKVADGLRSRDPDIAFLVEGGDGGYGEDDLFHDRFPDHQLARFPGAFVVISRWPVDLVEYTPLPGSGRAAIVRLKTPRGTVHLVMVDIAPKPTRSRGPSFDALEEILGRVPSGPLLVVGDFNTPRDSAYLDRWRERWAHAFETSGSGLDATWPAFLPVLSLDHVWGRGIQFDHCHLATVWASDHRMVVFDFRIPPTK